MGGMIAQTMAISGPSGASLTSVMSTTGAADKAAPQLRVWGC